MSRPGIHADGYAWLGNVTSNRPSHTLVNPDGHSVAHAFRANDRTWTVVDGGDGEPIATGLATAGEALKVADMEYRP